MLIFLLILAFVIIILIPTFLFSLIRTILSMLGFLFTGKKRRSSYSSRNSDFGSYNQRNSSRAEQPSDASSRKKMFAKDEGEYVDFEEIKDDK